MRTWLYFFIAFVICVPIGTLSHEFGHYITGKSLGYESRLYYDRASFDTDAENEKYLEFYRKHRDAIDSDIDFDGKTEYESYIEKIRLESFKITLGGVLDWIFVFLSLFWLRQIFNLAYSFFIGWYYQIEKYCSGDELKLALHLDLPSCSISYFLGVVGILICGVVTFIIVPRKYRLLLVSAGLLGSLIGYYLWMEVIGPITLPY